MRVRLRGRVCLRGRVRVRIRLRLGARGVHRVGAPVVVEELLVARVVVEVVVGVVEQLEHVAAVRGEQRHVRVVVVGVGLARLPPVPQELDVGVVALAGRLRATRLLVREVHVVVRLVRVSVSVRVRVRARVRARVVRARVLG